MDPAVLAQQATDILIPALSALCIAGKPAVDKGREVLVDMIYEKAFEKLGSGGGKRAQALLEKISPKMSESLKKALTNVSKNSEDQKAKEELQQEILKLLRENPDLAREIEIIITFDVENVDQLIVGNYNNIFNIETKSVEQTIKFIKHLDKRKKFSKTYEDRFEENQEHSLVVPNNPYKIFLEITSPCEGAEVDINEEVRGKIKNLSNNLKIWIVIRPFTQNRYHPQCEVIMHAGSDEWFAPVYIGIKSSFGQKFSILAVVANEKCQNKFENYIEVSKRTRKWLGIETLPEGAFIYKNITVIRKKRTVFSVKSFRHM